MTTKLGSFLKTARDQRKLTLRAVETATGISNAHVSQIESGRIREPSPRILHKLSELYGIPYQALLERAGYPVPSRPRQAAREGRILAEYGDISADEERSLGEYLEFLRSRMGRSRP